MKFWATCPSVLFNRQLYRMWYSSVYDNRMGYSGIGLATSKDGVHWKRANDGKPVLRVGQPGAFDDGLVLAPEVLYDGRIYRMWYTGSRIDWHKSGVCFTGWDWPLAKTVSTGIVLPAESRCWSSGWPIRMTKCRPPHHL